jgi:hypothetical protein
MRYCYSGNCDIDFLTFAIAKIKTSKFQICPNETKILQSTFETPKAKAIVNKVQRN